MKYPLILIFFLFIFFLNVQSISAHELATSGTIGAVLHIDPEDDPVVGQPAYFFFDFKDTENKLTSTNCSCQARILQKGKTIFTQDVFQKLNATLTNVNFSYTFVHSDNYQLLISGKPKDANTFQAFTLKYDISVSKPIPQKSANWFLKHLAHFISIAIVLAFIVIALVQKMIKKTTQHQHKEHTE